MSTEQKILAMLAGRDSQKPMPFDELAEKTGLLPDTLRMVLERMQHGLPATINCCTVTKGGETKTVYWPTGAVCDPLTFHQINNRNWQRALDAKPAIRGEEVQPNTAISQEQTMSKPGKGGKPSALNQKLYNLILVSPGISENELVKRVLKDSPNETEKHIRSTLSNMRSVGKKITGEGKGGDRKYHLDTRWTATAPAAPAASAAAPAPATAPAAAPRTLGKVVTGKEAAQLRNDPAEQDHVANDTKGADPAPVELIEVLLADDNRLYLTLGEEQFMLSPVQTTILHAFMQRVRLNVVPA